MSRLLNRLSRTATALALAGGLITGALLVAPDAALARQQSLPSPVAPVVEEVTAAPPLAPALWLVRDEDTTIYLFGTVHLLKPGLNWLRGPLADALMRSDTLVTEIVRTPDSDAALQDAVLDLAVLPEGQSLRALMKPEARKAYETLLVREGMRADTFDKFEPWYPALVLSMLPLMKQGMHPDAGVEEQLTKAHGPRRREGLESARSQIELFDTLPQSAQLAYLGSVVTHYDEIGPQMDDLVASWGKGDADKIGAVMLENMDSPEVAEVLMYRRNRAWATWIEQRLARPGTVFIAVGAGHLSGPDSVQHYLEVAGLKTDRVQ